MAQQDGGRREARKLSAGAIAALIGLAILIIFIVQNTQDIRVHFLAWDSTWMLWVYTIVIAITGALAWFGGNTIRRYRRRRESRR